MINETKIQSIKDNIFPHSINAVSDYYTFDWHIGKNKEIDTDKIQSSQAVVIDVFGLLKQSPNKNLLINTLFNKSGEDWNIEFEYIDKKLLNEKKSTQIDIILSSSESIILIESKFTEDDSGECSQHPKQCNGNYEEQTNPKNNQQNKCALTAKNIKYWEYIPKIYKLNSNENYCPCPFKKNQYQIMRNLCFGIALSEKKNIDVDNYFIYYEHEVCPIYRKIIEENYFETQAKYLLDKKSIKTLSYNQILKKTIEILNEKNHDECIKWIELEKWLINKVGIIKARATSLNKR